MLLRMLFSFPFYIAIVFIYRNKSISIKYSGTYKTIDAISGDEEKPMEAGVNDYLSKPISREKLIEVVYKYLVK